MSAIANCPISTSTAVLLRRWARWGVMSGFSILASFSHAVTFEVSTADEFQAALTTASNNGSDNTILLAPGLYLGNFAYIYNTPNKLVIESASTTAKPEETVIDGNDFAYSIFLNAKTAGTFELRRVKVMGGRSKEGASTIPVRGDNLASMVLEDVIVEDNVPEYRVPVDAKATEVIVRNSIIASVYEDNLGYIPPGSGGDAPRAGTVLITDSVIKSVPVFFVNVKRAQFTGNLFEGAAFDLSFGSGSSEQGVEGQPLLLIQDNSFLSQQLPAYLSVNNGDFVQVTDVSVEPRFQMIANEVMGGSLATYPVTVSGADFLIERNNLSESRFEFRSSAQKGSPGRVVGNTFTSSVGFESCQTSAFAPGIYATSGQWLGNVISGLGDVNVSDSIFRNNVLFSNVTVGLSFPDQGTGDAGLHEMIGNTFADNCSSINVSVATTTRLNLANNIFWGNGVDDGKKRDGVGLYFGGYGEELNAYNNIIDSHNAIWTNEEGNRSIDPKFYSPDSGDYHLSADSSGINAGNNAYVASDDSVDADGNPRINGGTVDLGAYERTTGGLHPADTNGDRSISSDEFNAYNAAWRANDIWPTAPAVITADFVTRAGYLLQKGGDYKNIGVGKPQTWVPVNE